jgi:ribosomal protein L5
MEPIKEKISKSYEVLKKDFDYTNKMQAPKIEKVVVSAGVGSFKDKKKIKYDGRKVTRKEVSVVA